MDTRLGRIRFLLDSWDTIWGPFVGSEFGSSGSGLPPMLSKMAHHPSVEELDRCLRELEKTDLAAFRHAKAYRCGVEWRCVTRSVRVKRSRGKGYEVLDRRVREPIVPSWIDPAKVRDAEAALSAAFQGEVFVPDELWDAWRRPAVAA